MKNLRIWCLAAVLSISLSSACWAANIGYSDLNGTFNENVGGDYFKQGKQVFVASPDSADVLTKLESGKLDYAVIYKENSRFGPAYGNIDRVMRNDALVVVQELNIPMKSVLFGLNGTILSEVKTVYTDPQGFLQSKMWLNYNLPQAAIKEVPNAKEALRLLQLNGDHTVAAIAGSLPKDMAGVAALAVNIQTGTPIMGRFWVVKAVDNPVFADGEKALVYIKAPSATLGKAIRALVNDGYELAAIHDRPSQTMLGEYNYVLEIVGKGEKKKLKNILTNAVKDGSIVIKGIYNSRYY